MQREVLNLFEYRSLQYLLMKYEYVYRNCYPLCGASIYGDKVIYMTDSHAGNGETENLRLMDVVYNEALRQNVRTAVHLGDLLEGTPVEHEKPAEVVEGEFDKAESLMPDEIKTWLLLGNHEYSAIRTYPVLIDKFFTSTKLEVLGMGKCLIFWNGSIIRLNHQITQLQNGLEVNEPRGIIELSGHVHYYKAEIEKRNIYVPPLCKVGNDFSKEALKKYGINLVSSREAFVISSQPDINTILFEVFGVDSETYKVNGISEKVEVDRTTKRISLYRS
ncbi:MAG TPA: hypothetical protein DCY94_00835 [Firmicutes bacterium]|nr:hypothetical protein [Bacillota bacterium]